MSITIPESFLGSDEQAWLDSVDRALKGASRSRLVGKADDGFDIQPLYQQRKEAVPQNLRPAQTPWKIIQRIDLPDPAAANTQLLEDLNGGADGIELVLRASPFSLGQGVRLDGLASMETLFDQVLLDLIQLRIGAGPETISTLAMLSAYAERRGLDFKALDIRAGLDIFGWLATHGSFNADYDVVEARILDTIGYVSSNGLEIRQFSADGRPWHGAGATAAQELACAFSAAIANFRVLEKAGIDPSDWAKWIDFTLVADADQFGTIAKARAARRIWARILDACGLPQERMALHMQTSHRMATRKDPWVNILRSTVAAFAAGIGGADSVTVLPFTSALGLPDGFARRLARNTQSILVEESNLHQVADPSAGSGAIEARTENLVEAAWQQFQAIEAEGGILESLIGGGLQERLAASRTAVGKVIASRRRPITGVSEFPNLDETPVAVLESARGETAPVSDGVDLPAPGQGELFAAIRNAFSNGRQLAQVVTRATEAEKAITVDKIPFERLAEPFEDLRDAADLSDGETPPAVYLACLGPLAQFTARASWVSNAIAAGGIATVGVEARESLDEIVADFKASGARIACLVSSDSIYEAEAEAAATALKAAGASHLYLAGKPGDMEEKLRAAGIDTFIFAGCNLLELLGEMHERLGLAAGKEASA
jgi:methylmalonyl-CoA mutase